MKIRPSPDHGVVGRWEWKEYRVDEQEPKERSEVGQTESQLPQLLSETVEDDGGEALPLPLQRHLED